MSYVRDWFAYHSTIRHLLLPIWVRVPVKARWRIADFLNRSDWFCWADLVGAVQHPKDGSDACDGHLPLPSSGPCRNKCGWLQPHDDHTHCTCYCGKFQGLGGAR